MPTHIKLPLLLDPLQLYLVEGHVVQRGPARAPEAVGQRRGRAHSAREVRQVPDYRLAAVHTSLAAFVGLWSRSLGFLSQILEMRRVPLVIQPLAVTH